MQHAAAVDPPCLGGVQHPVHLPPGYLQGNVGKPALKPAKGLVQIGQKEGGQAFREGHLQGGLPGGKTKSVRPHAVELLRYPGALQGQAGSAFGEGKVIALIVKQGGAQFLFYGGNGLPQGLAGNKQSSGGTGIIQSFRCFQKVAKLGDIHVPSSKTQAQPADVDKLYLLFPKK